VQGPLKIDSGCGDDVISISQTNGQIILTSGAGIHSTTNITVADTSGGIDMNLGSAKSHRLTINDTRGDVSIDTGFKVERSFVSIGHTIGDINVNMGGGKLHNVSLSNTKGDTSLKFDLGDKFIDAYNTTGDFAVKLNKGNDHVFVDKAQGEISIKSGNGLHEYTLNQIQGLVDVQVGDSGFLSNHLFNLTNIDGYVNLIAGDGNCIINGYQMVGVLTGDFGNGNDDILLVNTAMDVHLTSGDGNRNILATATSGKFTANFGNGNDNIDLHGTGAINIQSGDGSHNAKFDSTIGDIEVLVGHAVGIGQSQSFTITQTTGSIKLQTGKGGHHVIVKDTLNGEVLIKTGRSSSINIFDIRDTVNGAVNILSDGGQGNDIEIKNTIDGASLNGDISIIVGSGPCTLDIANASGDAYIDLQGSGEDVIDMQEIGGNIDVKTWFDSDLVRGNKLYGNVLIDTGAGNDKIYISYSGGNGTILGGTGDDMLLLDPRGSSGHPTNTMDGSHLSWYGGGNADRVEMYFVPTGSIILNFYETDVNQLFTRCSDEDDFFNPSFDSGLQPQDILDSMGGYLSISVQDCCAAHFSWDTMCGENSVRWLTKTKLDNFNGPSTISYKNSSLKFYAVDDHCDAKDMSQFRLSEERFESLDECCRAKFPQSISDCCEAGNENDGLGCSLSGYVKFIPVSHSCISIE
jgi:hypothetical protein